MNDDFLKQFRKPARKSFAKQLHQRLVEKQREKLARSNHTHKEKKDMNRTIALPYQEGPYSGLLTVAVAAMAALALAFIIMIGYTSTNTIFTGMFQDTEQRQRDAVQVYINQAWNAGDTNRLNDLLTGDHVTTTTLFGTVEGTEGVANLINAYRAAIPDFLYTIEGLEIDGETVWVRGTITGTHSGAFTLPDGTEIPPSGNTITIDSVIQFRFEDGDIAEINQIDNTQDLMEQMSAAQPMEEVAMQNRNIEWSLLMHMRSLPLPPDDVPIEKYEEFNPFHMWVHVPFGDSSVDFGGNLTKESDRIQFGSVVLDRDVTIRDVTATGDFAAFHYAVSGVVNTDHEWQSLRLGRQYTEPGEVVTWEGVTIFRVESERWTGFTDAWIYWDFEEMADVDYHLLPR